MKSRGSVPDMYEYVASKHGKYTLLSFHEGTQYGIVGIVDRIMRLSSF
jgi:hypothetical protein